ncbi:MAG: hypothetical protein WAN40_03015 [Thermoplasmata archaeon]
MNSGVPPDVAGLTIPPSLLPAAPAASRPSALRQWLRSHRPALVLVGLSILIPELLTGSTPVAALLNPVGDLFLIGLYGGGVLVIREITLRWNRGWAPVLLLGAAYGIAEEGLGTKTFFDWAEIGHPNYGPYTHWAGVNWVWAGELTLFHAIFSIALPIVLVGLLYPVSRGRPFLSSRGLGWTFGAYLLTVTLMFFLFERSYVLSPPLVAGCLIAIALLVLAARKIPAEWLRPRSPLPRIAPRAALLLGAVFVWGFFIVFWGTPMLLQDPFLTVALGWTFSAVCLLVLRFTIGSAGNESQLAYLSVGLLTFLIFDAAIENLLGDLFAFLAIVAAVGLMTVLYRRYRSPNPVESIPAGLAVE